MDNRKQPADAGRYQYFVVLKSESLIAPAIFVSYEDCSVYIHRGEGNNASSTVDYKAFESLENAAHYLKQYLSNQESSKMRYSTAIQDKRRMQFYETWDKMIEKLKEYKQKHGHCNVPARSDSLEDEDVPLSKWVQQMRRKIKEYEENQENSEFDDNKIQLLMDMGFNKTTKRGAMHGAKRKRASDEDDNIEFDTMIKQLKECRDKKEPIKRNNKLQSWVSKQRKEYQLYKENKESSMTPERIGQLAGHGFNFEAKKTFMWDERAVQWLEFRHKHGKDPKRYTEDGLGKWCTSQRAKYKIFKAGGKTNLTEDQVKRLTEWGFSWESKIKMPENIATKRPWEHRFEQLKEFQRQNGHCVVPQSTPQLGHWVHSQRSDYRKFMRGQKSGMSKERIEKLNSVGFLFSAGKGGRNQNNSVARKPDIHCDNSRVSESDNDELSRQFPFHL